MKKLGNEIKDFLFDVWDEIRYGLRMLCGKPTPMKRFIIVLVIGGSLCIAYLYILVNSIYSIGKREAENEFLKLQHIESLQLQSDSINNLNKKEYEYKQ
jgi:hypothetical protein